ncbi:MAG: hypothetical protein ACRD0K_08360 [Egibacteraceae bacterium]
MMVLDERSRHELYARLIDVLGSGEATTLMAHLPPVGWADVATKQDLLAVQRTLRSELGGKISSLGGEISSLRSELHGEINSLGGEISSLRSELHGEINSLRSELGSLRTEMHAVVTGAKHEVLATMRAEMISQTRMFVMASLTSVLATASLAFTAARFG